jgi:hypothetical protein
MAGANLAQQTYDLCNEGMIANRGTRGRKGALVTLSSEDGDDIVISTDIHGQRLNFEQLVEIADLANNPRRHLLMQEVCHGGPTYPDGRGCMSHLVLEDVIRLKTEFPDRFHFILSNHELAEVMDFPIAKGNRMLNLQFRCGIEQMYGELAEEVRHRYVDFLLSCPRAVRLENGVFISHSAPEGVDRDGFDTEILNRNRLSADDMKPGGAAFQLVWGRDFRPRNAQVFAELVDAEILIHGHEPCKDGFHVPNNQQIILDCCGPNPVYVIIPIADAITHRDVVERIQSLN